MSGSDVAYIITALVIGSTLCLLPMISSIRKAGPRLRSVLVQQVVIGSCLAVFWIVWLVVGWLLLQSGNSLVGPYWLISAILMVLQLPLLALGIRASKRNAASAQIADQLQQNDVEIG